MRKNKITIALTALIIGATTLGGCKKFLDVNQNPNNPEKADPRLVLPSTQAALGQVTGNFFQVYGGFYSQYWTQNRNSSQYRNIDRYQLANGDFDRPWRVIYSDAWADLDLIISQKADAQFSQHAAIALILKAYDAQLATDAFGDIPVKEANQGTANSNPKYDSQKDVYDAIFSMIDQGNALLNVNAPVKPGTEDLIFKGNIADWKAFANTLKLRAALRLSEVAPDVAKAKVEELYKANAVFLNKDAQIQYVSTGGNSNPLYEEMVGLSRVPNLVASSTIIDQLSANNDPRVKFYYDTIKTGKYIGIPQGSFLKPNVETSYPNALVGANPLVELASVASTAPVKFITAAESYFLQAEAVQRGWSNGTGVASDLYTQGITASFTATNQATAAAAYIAGAGKWPADATQQIKAIITQKYFAMCGLQNFEAWSEWRRTGYPDFFKLSEAGVNGNLFPVRLLYPNSEITRNTNFPGQKLITDRVWWDVK